MVSSVEARCIVCHLVFCCGDCRWNHERNIHGLEYNCPICRGFRFLCKPEDLNPAFIQHLAEDHLPLQCRKCNQIFENMEDFLNIDKCTSISEIIIENSSNNIEEKFDSLYEKVTNNNEGESKNTANKNNKTAVVTPTVRKSHLVDYESSDTEEDDKVEEIKTPHPKLVGKTPKLKKQRCATPHVKKLLTLMKQQVVDDYDDTVDVENYNGSPKTTPLRDDDNANVPKEMTTPTSQIPNLLKLAQIVTTSTPTHPLTGGWALFPEQGSDSPLSEIENAESPAQNTNNEPSNSELEAVPPKLKSIIITGSKIRISSQDSSEKHVTFQDSNTEVSMKKRVKFAEDTVFDQQPKIKRVFRKPKRMLTPGPQKPRFCYNPRFQALINRFENQGLIMARTPVNNREQPQESTPPVGEPSNMQARAIDFKEESPVVDISKESNDSYKTCIASPDVNEAISSLTANIAGSLQTCLQSALKTTEENTEIQFKFVITKTIFSLKSLDGQSANEHITDNMESNPDSRTENIWSSVAKAVKNVFWGEQGSSYATATTPHRSLDSINSSSSSASKRKIDDISDSELSPLNHKRHKYEGRIRGRPPLRRSNWPVATLRSSQSAEQHNLVQKIQDDAMNLSF